MNRVLTCFLTLTLCCAPRFAYTQRDFSDVEIKATHVAGPVYMLEGSGGNIGVSVGEDGILIVDNQFAGLADKIRAALKELSDGKLEFVLNTHYHGDHTGGNAEFGEDAHIVAHSNVRKRLANDDQPEAALPIITFDKSLSIHFNGEEIRVVHFPLGHTDTDSMIFFTGSNVVHMGDHFFSGRFPFIDLESGGDVEGFAENITSAIDRIPEGAKIIPGHGPLSTIEDLKTTRGMLTECISIVRDQIAAGKSLDAIKAKGLPDKYAGWGSGFISEERWLSILYSSLAR